MMPKKGRREITVDGVMYYYKISGYVHATIQNSITNKLTTWFEEWKPKWGNSLTPKHIRAIILGEM